MLKFHRLPLPKYSQSLEKKQNKKKNQQIDPCPCVMFSRPFQTSDEPLLLALINSFSEGWVIDNNGCISTVCWVCSLGLIRVVWALVTKHVANHEHHDAQHCQDDQGDNTWERNKTKGMLRRFILKDDKKYRRTKSEDINEIHMA